MAISPSILKQVTANPCSKDTCEARMEQCYAGQWTAHPAHHYEVCLMKWQGGGTEMRHCAGKAEGAR